MSNGDRFVYVTFIRTTPEKLWDALIKPEFTRQYWFGTWQESAWKEGSSWQTLGMKGDELVTIRGLHGELKPRMKMQAEIVAADGGLKRVPLICRIDTLDELDYFKHGGILQYVIRQLIAS